MIRELYLGDAADILPTLTHRVQMVYMDPPFFTGRRMMYKDAVAYEDSFPSRDVYLLIMHNIIAAARELLLGDGVMYLHIDSRMHAHLRLIMDQIFGETMFMNDIVWRYQTGGRATRHFSRKHDNILLYSKTAHPYFDIKAVPIPRENKNHMKRGVDENGAAYRSIKSGGKEYRYYDDDPAYLDDVWTDISHIQQRDPERTGYETQKPLKLLNRMILTSTREGDTVLDPCCGSGTTPLAAQALNRGFVGVDSSKIAIQITHERINTLK